jgi:hypothetical protein
MATEFQDRNGNGFSSIHVRAALGVKKSGKKILKKNFKKIF